MRIYTRTYLQIALVILSSTVITFIMVTGFLMRSNEEQRIRQLQQQAEQVSRNLSVKKNTAWLSITRIHSDTMLGDELAKENPDPDIIMNRLLDKVDAGTADFFVLGGVVKTIIPLDADRNAPPGFSELNLDRWHPYLEFLVINNRLWMVGGVKVFAAGGETGTDVFIVKELDDEFCRDMAFGTPADIMLLDGEKGLAGTLPGNTLILPVENQGNRDIRIYLNQIINGDAWNLAIFSQDVLSPDREPLEVVVLNQNLSFRENMFRLFLGLTLIILGSALVTSLVSLLISRSISKPLERLSEAFRGLHEGNLKTRMNPEEMKEGSEERQLFQEFNDMVLTLESDRLQIDSLLRDNEMVLQSLRSGVGVVGADMKFEMVNQRLIELLHLDEDFRNKTLDEIDNLLFSAGVLRRFETLVSGESASYRRTRQGKGDSVFDLGAFVYPPAAEKPEKPRILLVLDDVSEKMRAEQAMFQAERISSLSLLSAGVAHEINNPLGSIMTNVQNLIEGERDDESRRILEWIISETRRIAQIVRGLLDFSSSDPLPLYAGSLSELIRATVGFLSHGGDSGISFQLELEEPFPGLSISGDDFRQILLNLVQNAIESLDGEGRILIRTWTENRYAYIEVADDGPGIEEDLKGRIFDPFFTTKGNNGGTGLGLSVVYGILNRNGGDIRVETSLWGGTGMIIKIPKENG
jgi:signal transduction histidine kinase